MGWGTANTSDVSGRSTRWAWRSTRARSSTPASAVENTSSTEALVAKPEVSQVPGVELDPHAGLLGLLAALLDLLGRGGGHARGAPLGEGDGVGGAAELDHPLAVDVAAEPQVAVVRHAGPVGDGADHGAMMTPTRTLGGGCRPAAPRAVPCAP